MRLSPAQVTLLKVELDRFQGNVASRGVNYHTAMEEFMEEALRVVLPPPLQSLRPGYTPPPEIQGDTTQTVR